MHNGIDTAEYQPDPGTDVLEQHGIDPDRPSVVFVGRITRQKGLPHLLRAALSLDPAVQLVLCAGRARHPGDRRGGDRCWSTRCAADRDGVIWIPQMLPKPDVIQILTHATVFVCPSIYEPMGIVNLEAMACEVPVVATATGGIPEVVADGETGLLVPIEQVDDGTGTPLDAGPLRGRPRRPHSRRSSPTRSGPARWARPAGGARSSSSPGPRSPPAPSTSTARCSELPVGEAHRLRRCGSGCAAISWLERADRGGRARQQARAGRHHGRSPERPLSHCPSAWGPNVAVSPHRQAAGRLDPAPGGGVELAEHRARAAASPA